MSRGNRWQLIVLVASIALLAVTVVTRQVDESEPAPTATPPPTAPLPQRESPAFFTEALAGEVRKLNPLLAGANQADRDIAALIFEGLTANDAYGQIVPALAKSWTVSRDATVFTFTLRDDVLWHDGVSFTSADVAFTLRLLHTPGFGEGVPGLESLAAFWRTVEFEALDEYTVRFRLTQPLASFPDFLRLGILPEHVLGNAPPDAILTHPFNLDPIGTGPYQMELLRVDDGRVAVVQLRRAPTYAEREGAQTYQLERIIFNLYENAETALAAFERGEVNAVGYIPTALLETATQTPGMAVYTALEPTVGFVLFNFGRETTTFFQDRRFRAALAYGTDSEGLVREHLDGQVVPATNPLIPGSWAWDPSVTWPQRNYETAQTLLSRARVDLPVSFTLLCPDSPEMVALCNDIAAQWSDLDGVSVTVETAEQPALLERVRARDFDAAIVELSLAGMADPDPYVFWHQGQIESGQNYGGVDDGPISEALEQARRDPSGVNRASWYRLFQQRFAERVPAIPLYYPVYAYGVDNQIEGVQLGLISDPSDRFRSLWAWSY